MCDVRRGCGVWIIIIQCETPVLRSFLVSEKRAIEYTLLGGDIMHFYCGIDETHTVECAMGSHGNKQRCGVSSRYLDSSYVV